MTSRIDIGSAPVRPHVRGPEIIILGAACRDVAPDDPRGWRLGGGVSYAALATARLGLRISKRNSSYAVLSSWIRDACN